MPASPNSGRVFSVQALVPVVIAVLACGVSVVLTVLFCLELRGERSVLAGAVAVAIGLACELAKFYFGPLGIRLLFSSGRPALSVRGVGLSMLSAVLVVVSFGASMGYLLELDSARRRGAVVASSHYRDLEIRVAALDSELEILRENAALDTRSGYRSRALSTLSQLDELRSARNQLSRRLANFESAPRTAAAEPGMLGAIATALGIEFDRVRWVAHATVAVLLELIGLAALSLLPVGVATAAAGRLHVVDESVTPATRSSEDCAEATAAAAGRLHVVDESATPATRSSEDCAEAAAVEEGRLHVVDELATPATRSSEDCAKNGCENTEEAAVEAGQLHVVDESATPATRSSEDCAEAAAVEEGRLHVVDESATPATRSSDDCGKNCGTYFERSSDEKYIEAVRLVVAGQVDPSNRGLQRGLHVGQRTAARLLQAMVANGLVRSAHGRYEVAVEV